jgi:hypothetical protein
MTAAHYLAPFYGSTLIIGIAAYIAKINTAIQRYQSGLIICRCHIDP